MNRIEQERLFDDEMLDVYRRARSECQYDAKLFASMIGPGKGLAATKLLLNAPRVQSGFEKLWILKRLDISMEARILKPKFADLFDPGELREARIRFESAGYDYRRSYDE